MPILSNLIVRIGASTDDFDKQVDRSLNKVKRFAADVTAAGTALSIGFSAPLIAAGAAAIKAGSDMESLTMGLKAVMKTSEATAAEMAKLRDVAKLPGLGLEEAVKGTIRLQILGNSANESRRIMAELGNALAVVGGGREDFNEVIRQLSHLGAVGKVTKENLDPIVERIPQIAAIIKEKFGAEALGDPAKTFEKLGISSQKFIQIITDELAKGESAGNTYKNSWKNIQDAATNAAAEFGKTLLPIAQRVLDDFLTPGIEKAKALATAFRDLPQPTQGWALGLTAVATAAPLVLVALGTLIEKGALVLGALNKVTPKLKTFAEWLLKIGPWAVTAASGITSSFWPAVDGLAARLTAVAGGMSVMGAASVSAGAAVAGFMAMLISHRQSTVDTSAEALKRLNERVGTGTPVAFGAGTDAIVGFMRLLPPTTEEVKKHGDEHEKSGKKVFKHASELAAIIKQTFAAAVEHKSLSLILSDYQEHVSKAAELSQRYGSTSIDAAISVAKLADAQFRLNRQLSDAPDLGGLGIDFSKLPKAQMPTFQGPENVSMMSDFPGAGKAFPNIGPTGMMTREQLEAQKQKMKELGKVGKAAYQQVSTVVTDLSRGITDVIFKGGKLGDMFANVAQQAAQSITRLLIEGALTKLASKLMDVGGLMGAVFGGGTGVVKSVAGGAMGDLGGAAKTASSGIGGAAFAASGSLTAVVGAVGSVVSAVSGVIGNFQMSGMNKSLDLIVKHTLQAANDLANLRADSWLREGHLMAKLDDMWKTNIGIYDLLGRGAIAGGGASVIINLNGGDPKAALEEITRTLKQYGVIPRG
jgi:tape measure domain-containing protein